MPEKPVHSSDYIPLSIPSASKQPAHTDKTDTDGGIRFKHLGVSKAWNVLACCDKMIDGERRLGV